MRTGTQSAVHVHNYRYIWFTDYYIHTYVCVVVFGSMASGTYKSSCVHVHCVCVCCTSIGILIIIYMYVYVGHLLCLQLSCHVFNWVHEVHASMLPNYGLKV